MSCWRGDGDIQCVTLRLRRWCLRGTSHQLGSRSMELRNCRAKLGRRGARKEGCEAKAFGLVRCCSSRHGVWQGSPGLQVVAD